MISHSRAYAEAVAGDSRKQFIRATFDLVDPDAQITNITVSGSGAGSQKGQLINRGLGEGELPLASLETGRWLLDGTFDFLPVTDEEQRGWESDVLSGDDGTFAAPPHIELTISGVEILQAVTLEFSGQDFNGIPTEFTLDIYSGASLLHTETVTGNTKTALVMDGFTVNYPTRLRLTVNAWSLPHRRARIVRLLLGLYENWDTTIIKSVDIYSEVTFSGLKIPYSTCAIEVYNEDHRFDPYAPNTIFTSLEDRQAIVVELGLRLADGSIEWVPGGTWYQQSAGWKLKDLTVEWSLLDIIGALVKRRFVVPDTMPTTVAGWLEAIMGSLGVNFRQNYIVDETTGALPLTATAEAVTGKMCGELLRFLCMATNTWPQQDMATGFLRVGPINRVEGNRITLDNMPEYPIMKANSDIADITFTLDNGEVTFPGNNTDSEVSLSVNNPFVHTETDARKAVVSCLFEYGGRSFDVTSRGNPTSECGDIMAVDTQFLSTISARLYKQQLKFDVGVMRNVPSHLVQSPNDSMYANKAFLTGSGSWTAPVAGPVKFTLIGGGTGGQGGGGGVMLWGDSFDPDDTLGDIGGDGGKVFITETTATAGQIYSYSCGAGGAGGAGGGKNQDGQLGAEGGDTTMGVFTSANGTRYGAGIMDIQSGAVYAQKGADNGGRVSGLNGSGGSGGVHGRNGRYAQYEDKDGRWHTYEAAKAKPGTAGTAGKEGCVIAEW